MQPYDYGALLRSGASLVPDYASQQLQQQQLQMQEREQGMQQQQFQMKQAQEQRGLDEEVAYKDALQDYLTDRNPQKLANMAMRFPKQKEAMDTALKMTSDVDAQSMAELYGLGRSGRFDLAAAKLKARIAADSASGQDVAEDEAMLAMMESGDPEQQKQAMDVIGSFVAFKYPEGYKAVNPADKQSPWLKEYNDKVSVYGKDTADQMERNDQIKIGPAGGLVLTPEYMSSLTGSGLQAGPEAQQPEAGEPATGGSGVASALSSQGFPPVVVAGFLGNFEHESSLGQNKASGDGGTAHGLAQWRNERVNNFQRVIGKHPNKSSLDEQVKFVGWEMKNPTAAGMTIAQRDAILAAKTPEQAAALIDRYYERSNGKSRSARAKSARGFYTGGGESGLKKVTSKAQYEALLSGTEYTAPDGTRRRKP